MHDISIPLMLTINETAATFGMSPYAVRRMVKSGKVVAVQVGCKYLVNADRFSEFLNSHTLGADEQQEASTSGIKPVPIDI